MKTGTDAQKGYTLCSELEKGEGAGEVSLNTDEHVYTRYYRQSIGFSYWRGRTTEREVHRGYVITKNLDDFGALPEDPGKTHILKIPAALACYWLGQGEATDAED